MKDLQSRENFKARLEEAVEIAKACDELPSAAVLLTLLGSLAAGNERELLEICTLFNHHQIARIKSMEGAK